MISLHHKKKHSGFTLVEIIVVLVVLAALGGLAIPRLTKTIETGRCRNARQNLIAIHAALKMDEARRGSYYPTSPLDLNGINAAFNLNINDPDFTYTYTRTGAGTGFTVSATRAGTSYTVTINEGLIADPNPFCSSGTCPCETP